MTLILKQCLVCSRYKGKLTGRSGPSCEAFDVIPEAILAGDHDHAKPFPGDNGIRFEPLQPGK